MLYTCRENVKDALQIKGTVTDALLDRLIEAGSRAVDLVVTGTPLGQNYFEQAVVSNEKLRGIVDVEGSILCWPHKSPIAAVTGFSWRQNPISGWTYVDLASNAELAEVVGPYAVKVWAQLGFRPNAVQVCLNYSGGFGAATDDLPADLVELATLLAGRFYREDEGGLTDAIGVAEIGSVIYTRALPQRFEKMIQNYKRIVPW